MWQYVNGYKTCQHIKLQRQKLFEPLQPLEIPGSLWQHVSMNSVNPLPMSQGCNMIQVVCDKSTKRAHFLDAHSIDDMVAMCNGFIKCVWCLHGMSKKVVSDWRP